jgi:Tol biopolymer transport system component
MNADGSGQRKLAMVSGSDELVPSWSPDGKHIAFVAMTPCEPYFCSDLALWVVRPDGSGLRRVVHNVRQPWRPLWSPDGTRLLFGQILNPSGEIDTLVVLRLADGATWTLGAGGRPVSMFEDWSWSPDGRRVAYMASNGDTTDAYVEGARGRGRRLLAHFVYGVQWSPAGGEIAVIKRFGKRTIRLATVPVRGGLPRKIASADHFAWDRSGRRLALFRGLHPVAVVGRDGRHFRMVSSRSGWPDDSDVPDGPSFGPWSWSADGKTFVYPATVSD